MNPDMSGFRSFPANVGYVLYEIKSEESAKPIAVKHLSTANRCRNLMRAADKICFVSKRIGFMDNGCIYCTNGNTHVADLITHHELKLCCATTIFDVLEAFGIFS
jgi:hypothetical protein